MTEQRDDRLRRLAVRLTKDAGASLSAERWSEAVELLLDALAADADNERARELLALARRRASRTSTGLRRNLTVLFCDQVGSTEFVSRHDAEHVMRVRRTFHDVAGAAIQRYGGHIHEYSGDGLLAYFCYPTAHEDDARRAVETALDIVDNLEGVRSAVADELGDRFRVRIGIHTGEVVVADLGNDDRPADDAIVGVTPNLAARLQDLAPPDGIVISSTTAELTDGEFDLVDLGPHDLKGIDGTVDIHLVARRRSDAARIDALSEHPIVGREAEIDEIERAWRAVHRTGTEARCLAVTGPAGIGKSRLLRYLRDHSARTGGRPFLMEGDALRSLDPLHAIRRAVRRHAGLAGEEEPRERPWDRVNLSDQHRSALDHLVANASAGSPELHPTELRRVTVEAVVMWLRAKALQRPFALIVDDHQFLDASSAETVQAVRDHPTPGLLLAIGRRDAELGALTPDEHLEIGPLGETNARSLVGTFGLDASTVDEVLARADGVPLYLEELARNTTESVPSSLREALQSSIAGGLGHADLASLLATGGRETPLEFARLACGEVHPELQFEKELDALAATRLVSIQGDNAVFRHALVQSTIYESQLDDRRVANHAAFAAVLAAEGDPELNPNAAVAASHFSTAGQSTEAATYYLAASTQAQIAGAYEESLMLLEQVGRLQTTIAPEATPLVELGMRMNRALAVAATKGYADEAVAADFRASLGISQSLADIPELAPVLLPAHFGLWGYYAVHGDLVNTGPIVAHLRRQEAEQNDRDPNILAIVGMDQLFRGKIEGGLKSLTAAIEHAPGVGFAPPREWRLPNDPYTAALVIRALGSNVIGDTAGGDSDAVAALDAAGALPFPVGPFSAAFSHGYLAMAAGILGEPTRQATHARATLDLGVAHGFVDWIALGTIHLAAARAASGDAAAIGELTGAREMWQAAGAGLFVPVVMGFEAAALIAHERHSEASSLLERALAMCAETQQMFFMPELLRLRARIRPVSPGSAEDHLRRALALADEHGSALFAVRAATDLGTYDPSFSKNTLQRLRDQVRQDCSWWEAETAGNGVVR